MKNKKNIFNFFENIISYNNDVSKIFSKKDTCIPIVNSKKNVYCNKNKKNYNFSFNNIFILTIIVLTLTQLILMFLGLIKVNF